MTLWPLAMWWRDVAFFHWRVEAGSIAKLLPPGIDVDLHDGSAWLSVVPFRMTDIHLRGLPVLPGFGTVPEINLRTYVRVRDRPGIWFFSLDAPSRIVVDSARIVTALPYWNARVATSEDDGTIRYESARHDRRTVAGRFRAHYTPSAEKTAARAGSLEAFLHERYRFYSMRGKTLLTARVRHPSWELHELTATIVENTLGEIAGVDLGRPPDLARFGRAVDVRASLTTRAGEADASD